MKNSSLLGAVITAALAAVFFSRKANAANTDAQYAGVIAAGDAVFNVNIPVPVSSWDSPDIIGGLMDSLTPSNLSDAGVQALTQREGFSATPYPDHKGYSIGYGHLILPTENFTVIDEAQGRSIFMDDVAWAVAAVIHAIAVPLTQNQFDALVSFCFNVGKTAFSNSTLVKRINAGDSSAADEFGRWVYASGEVNSSLVARRQGESAQFLA